MFTIDLTGKVAVVTGISSGIGQGIARELAKAGAFVSGCATAPDNNDFLDEMQALNGASALYTQCDVSRAEDLQALVRRTVDKFGKIDILVSNAGRNSFIGAADTDLQAWQANMDLNFVSHWTLARLCKPYLEKQNGVIIVMTSNHAFSTIPGCFPYNITKTALTGLVRSLAIEWGPEIRTVGIAPGFIETPGNQKWFDSFADSNEERQRTVDLHPVKKLGTTEEIGGWCVFLASDYAAFASGTTYLVDGGRSALMQ